MWCELSLFPSTLDHMATYHEYPQRMEAKREELDKWLPRKRRLLELVADKVRCLTIVEPESLVFDGCLEPWTEALALHALRRCSGLEELVLAWPGSELTKEAASSRKRQRRRCRWAVVWALGWVVGFQPLKWAGRPCHVTA